MGEPDHFEGGVRTNRGSARPPATNRAESPADVSSEVLDERAKLRGVVEASIDGIITIDERGVIESVNPAAMRIFGYSTEEMVGRNVSILMPDPDRSGHDRYVGNYLQTGAARIIGIGREVVGLRKSGERFPMDLAISEVRLADRRIFTGWVRDITDRKATEAKERESHALLRAVVEAISDPIFAKGLDGRYNVANTSLAEVAGRTLDEIIGRTDAELFGPDDADAIATADKHILETGEPRTYELVTQLAGELRVFEVNKAPFRDAEGNLIGVRGISRDITLRKRAEQQAQERQAALAHLDRLRSMSQLATGLAHELNQPLGAIGNYAAAAKGMLASPHVKPQRVEEVLVSIVDEIERAGQIIKRMRSFVRKQTTTIQVTDANSIAREAIAILSYALRQAKIVPRMELADRLLPVHADTIQIQQVLVNLVRNATDAMESVPPGSRMLTVRTSQRGDDFVVFEVMDNGCGVSPENQARIFDAFFTTKKQGLGIGLALCRTIIEDHRGQLSFRANPSGAGLTFEFTLRCAKTGPTVPFRKQQETYENRI